MHETLTRNYEKQSCTVETVHLSIEYYVPYVTDAHVGRGAGQSKQI